MSNQIPAATFSVDGELDRLIRYHVGWKKFSSYASFSMTAMSIIAAAAASVTAGLKYSVAASILAALATVFTSLDKVLQFRERWDLHRVTGDAFELIRWEKEVKGLSNETVADRVAVVMHEYDRTMSSFRTRTSA